MTQFLGQNYPHVLAALRRQRCPVCDRALTHVPTDHLGVDTPPVFRCAEPGPEHASSPGTTPGAFWSTNGVQVAWYLTLRDAGPWLGWEQSMPPAELGQAHSRACGWKAHSHGPECSPDCPTCLRQLLGEEVDFSILPPVLRREGPIYEALENEMYSWAGINWDADPGGLDRAVCELLRALADVWPSASGREQGQ